MTRTIANTQQGDRVYTDHKAIFMTLNIPKHSDKKCERPLPVIVKNEEGDMKFLNYTDALAEDMIDLWNTGTDILEIFKVTMRKLSECERLSYLRISKKLPRKNVDI